MEFFAALGLEATCLAPPEHAEPKPYPGEAPDAYALRAALAKALAVLPLVPRFVQAEPSLGSPPLLIAADTVVALEKDILGKPRDAEHALAMLMRLKGKTHRVITACVLLGPAPAPPISFTAQSQVELWDCPSALLKAYAQDGEPLDKAGAYAVQGKGAFLVKRIEGSWSNVVGLPLAELVGALLERGAVRPCDVPPGSVLA